MSSFYDDPENEEFKQFLKELVATDDLKSPVDGIVKQVLARGRSSLSTKQEFLFNRDVVKNYTAECDTCMEQVPWSEAYEFHHSGPTCTSCQVKFDNFMAE